MAQILSNSRSSRPIRTPLKSIDHASKYRIYEIYHYFGAHFTEIRHFTGLSITRLWGRNSAPFPMPKSIFFSQFQTKNSQFEIFFFFFFFFFFLFSIFISYNTNTEHIVLHYISRKKVSLIIGINLAMETSYIRTMSNFPILVKTPRIFPIHWAPAPFPKRGVRALFY